MQFEDVPVWHEEHGTGGAVAMSDTDEGVLLFVVWDNAVIWAGWHGLDEVEVTSVRALDQLSSRCVS